MVELENDLKKLQIIESHIGSIKEVLKSLGIEDQDVQLDLFAKVVEGKVKFREVKRINKTVIEKL